MKNNNNQKSSSTSIIIFVKRLLVMVQLCLLGASSSSHMFGRCVRSAWISGCSRSTRISPLLSSSMIRPFTSSSSSFQATSSSAITTDDDTSSSSSSSRSETETNKKKDSSQNGGGALCYSIKDIASSLALHPSVRLFGGKIPYWDTTTNDTTATPSTFRVVFVLGGPGAGKGTQSELLTKHYNSSSSSSSGSMIHHLSVGQLLRDEQENKDSLVGATIRQALVSGQIVPVQISLSLVRQAMQHLVNNHNNSNDNKNDNSNIIINKRIQMQTIFLVDGFPRNDDNLSGWCRFMTPYFDKDDNNSKNDTRTTATTLYSSLWGVLVYHCPLQVLENRILERSQVSPGRSDDNLKSIQKRFQTFQQETVPIIEKLRQASSDDDNKNNSNWKVVDIRGDLPLNDVWLTTRRVFDEFIQHDVLSANAALLQAIQDGNEQAYQQLVSLNDDDDNNDNNDNNDSSLKCFQDEMATMTANDNDILEQISSPTIEFVSGQTVRVQYNRPVIIMNDNDKDATTTIMMMRETRVWVHQGPVLGWRNVECSRTIPTSSLS